MSKWANDFGPSPVLCLYSDRQILIVKTNTGLSLRRTEFVSHVKVKVNWHLEINQVLPMSFRDLSQLRNDVHAVMLFPYFGSFT